MTDEELDLLNHLRQRLKKCERACSIWTQRKEEAERMHAEAHAELGQCKAEMARLRAKAGLVEDGAGLAKAP